MKQVNKIPELKAVVIQAILMRSVKTITRVNDYCSHQLHSLAVSNANKNLIDKYVMLAQSMMEQPCATKRFWRAVKQMEAERLAL